MSLNVGDAYIALNVDAAGLTKQIAQSERQVQTFGKETEKTVAGMGSSFTKLGGVMTGIFQGIGIGVASKGLEALGGTFTKLKSSVIDYNATLEDSKISWGVLLGGADAAQKKLDELAKFAAVTPFEFPEVVKASQVMQTFGGDILNTTDNLTLIGNIAAGVGQPFEDVAMWTSRMYDAFQSGRPFGEASARLQEMGAMSGATRQKLEDMQAQGASGAEMWAVFNNEMGRFNQNGGMMAQLANSWNGRLATLGDTLTGLAAKAGKPIFDKLNVGLGKLVETVSTDKMTDFADVLGTQVAAGIESAFGKIGEGVRVGRELWSVVKEIGQAGGSLFSAFTSGDFNSAFGPILEAIDAAFGEKARDKAVMFVSGALSGLQNVRDTVLTIGQAWAGQWQDSDSIANPFVRGAGRITQVLSDSFATAQQAWSGNWVDSDQISNPFVRATGNIAAFFREIPGKVGDVWTSIADQVGPALAPIGETIGHIFDTFKTGGAQNGAQSIVSAILGPDAGEQFSAKINDMRSALDPFLNAIKGFDYQGMFATIAADAQTLGTALVPVAKGFADLYLSVAPMGAIIGPLTDRFNIWADLGQKLGPILTNTVGAAFYGLQGAIAPIGEQFAKLGAVFAEQGPQFEEIGTKLMDVWQAVTPILQAAGAVIGGVIVVQIGLWISTMGGLVGLLSGALPGVLQAFGGLLDILSGTFKLLVNTFQTGIAVFVALIHGDWAGAWEELQAGGKRALDAIIQMWTGAKDLILGLVTGLFGGIVGAAEGFAKTFVGFFQGIYDAIIGHSIIPDLVTGVETAITGMITAVTTTISGWVTTMTTHFTDLRDKIFGVVDEWTGGTLTRMQTWSGNMVTEIGNAVTGILNKLSGVKDSIQTAILAPFLGASGLIGSIMEGFRKAMIGPLQTALNSMASFGGGIAGVINWIANALKLPINIGTPSVPQLATGTHDFQGGPAIVGEEGPELVYMPKHAIVIPNKMSQYLLKTGLVPGFAGGLNLPSLGDLIKGGPEWLLQRAIDAIGVPTPALPGVLAGGGKLIFDQIKGWLTDAVTHFISEALPVSPKNIKAMQDFVASHVGEPYTWGGGHGGAAGFDCSGWVAAVLDAGGIPNPHGIVTAFYEWMQGGRTGVVDIGVDDPYAAPDVQHTGIGVMGQWSEAGGRAGGVGYTSDYFSNVGHPPGFDVSKAKGPGVWDYIDWEQSLKNAKRPGALGQWSLFAEGGTISETVVGRGRSGRGYVIGENGPEVVTPVKDLATLADVLVAAIRAAATMITDAITQIGHVGTVGGGGGGGGAKGPDQVGPPAAASSGKTDPASPDYEGPAGTGTYDAELMNPPDGTLKPEWDKRRRFLGLPTSAEQARKSTNVSPGNRPTRAEQPTDTPPAKPAGAGQPGMIGHFPEPVMPHPGHPGWWVGVNTGNVYDGDGKLQSGTTPAGMVGHFPERVLPHPGHPGWWIGVETGTVYDGDGKVVSSPITGLPGGPVPVSPSGDPLTASGPMKWSQAASGKLPLGFPEPPTIRPPLNLPGQTGMIGHFPEPVVPHPGKPGKWVGVNTGTVYNGDGTPEQEMTLGLPGPATIIPPKPPPVGPGASQPGMIGHFPEPVAPHPGHPGWWVGVNTGTVYDGDGKPVSLTASPPPSAAPTTGSPGRGRGGDSPAAPGTTPTTGTGKGTPATLVIESRETFEMPDGTVIVKTIVSNEIALEDLTEGVTGIQAREKERIKSDRGGSGSGAIRRLT